MRRAPRNPRLPRPKTACDCFAKIKISRSSRHEPCGQNLGTPISRLASLGRRKPPIGRLAFPGEIEPNPLWRADCSNLNLRELNFGLSQCCSPPLQRRGLAARKNSILFSGVADCSPFFPEPRIPPRYLPRLGPWPSRRYRWARWPGTVALDNRFFSRSRR